MSIRIMSEAWKLEIPTVPKLLLLALADNCGEDGFCKNSLEILFKKTSLDLLGLTEAFSALFEMGITYKPAARHEFFLVQIKPIEEWGFYER